jgi:hypothetical protein
MLMKLEVLADADTVARKAAAMAGDRQGEG